MLDRHCDGAFCHPSADGSEIVLVGFDADHGGRFGAAEPVDRRRRYNANMTAGTGGTAEAGSCVVT